MIEYKKIFESILTEFHKKPITEATFRRVRNSDGSTTTSPQPKAVSNNGETTGSFTAKNGRTYRFHYVEDDASITVLSGDFDLAGAVKKPPADYAIISTLAGVHAKLIASPIQEWVISLLRKNKQISFGDIMKNTPYKCTDTTSSISSELISTLDKYLKFGGSPNQIIKDTKTLSPKEESAIVLFINEHGLSDKALSSIARNPKMAEAAEQCKSAIEKLIKIHNNGANSKFTLVCKFFAYIFGNLDTETEYSKFLRNLEAKSTTDIQQDIKYIANVRKHIVSKNISSIQELEQLVHQMIASGEQKNAIDSIFKLANTKYMQKELAKVEY